MCRIKILKRVTGMKSKKQYNGTINFTNKATKDT